MKYSACDIAACMDVALMYDRGVAQKSGKIDYYLKTVKNCRKLAEKLNIPWQEVMDCFRGNKTFPVKRDLWEKVAHPGLLVYEIMDL